MKLKKLLIIPALVLTLGLTACGGGNKDISLDVQKTADALKETVTSYELSATGNVETNFNLSYADLGIVNAAAYQEVASHAQQVCVVECEEASQAEEVKKAFEERVEGLIPSYESYYPEDVPMLKDAVIETAGKYAVLCVTDDADAAKKVLKEAGF